MKSSTHTPTLKQLDKSFVVGWEYAEAMCRNGDGWDDLVDIDAQLGSTSEMPCEDYRRLKKMGETPDARAYWQGWNAHKDSIAAEKGE